MNCMKVIIVFFVGWFLCVTELFSETVELTPSHMGWKNVGGFSYTSTQGIRIGFKDNQYPLNNTKSRGFAYFTLPDYLSNSTINTAAFSYKIYELSQNEPDYINLYITSMDWDTFSNLTVMNPGPTLTHFQDDSSDFSGSVFFEVFNIDELNKKEVGFILVADPEEPSGTMSDDSNFLTATSVTLTIEYTLPAPTLTSIKIIGLLNVNENSESQYSCRAYYSDDSSELVSSSASWSLNSSDASIDSSGNLTTYSVSSDKPVTITVSYDGKSDTHDITIKNLPDPVELSSISISGPSTMTENSWALYTCTANYSDDTAKTVTPLWSVNSTDASIDSVGKVTTGDVNSNQKFTITAVYNEKTAVKEVSVVKICRTLTVNSSGASSVPISASPSTYGGTTSYSKSINDGTMLSLTAPAKHDGKTFSGWSGAVESKTRTINITMDEHKTLAVSYEGIVPPSSAYIAYYPFDRNADDASGNNRHGSMVNSPTFVEGKEGQSVFLQGRDHLGENGDHVLLPYINFSDYDSFSIALWVNLQGDASYEEHGEAFISFGEHNDEELEAIGMGFFWGPDYDVRFSSGGVNASNSLLESCWSNWTHYALTYTQGIMRAYIDGQLMNSATGAVAQASTNSGIGIHWWDGGASTRFVGAIDEVYIYNKSLSVDEIQSLISSPGVVSSNQFLAPIWLLLSP